MNRTLIWMLAALVAFPALAAAEEYRPIATVATDTFALGAEPARSGAYVVHAKSRVEQTLTLGVEGLPEGYVASFSPAQLNVGPDAPARATLTLAGPDDRPIAFVAYATNDAGERHAVKLAPHAAKPTPTAGTFGLKAEPEGQRIAPGGEAKFVIHVRSAQKQTLALSAHLARGEGYRFEVSPASLDVGPDAPGIATLIVHAGPNASAAAAFEIVGSNGAERHGAVVKVGLADATHDKPRPVANDAQDVRITIEVPGREPIVLRLPLALFKQATERLRLATDG